MIFVAEKGKYFYYCHMEDKKFNPENMDHLNDPDRLERLAPGKVMDFIKMKAPEKIVDIGAGTAYITSALARLMPGAKIEAFDIEPLMVEEMQRALPKSGNITPHLMEENRLPLSDEYADLVWMINLYHEVRKPYLLLREVKRVLKPGGKLLIIDWAKNPESTEDGPPLDHRIDEATITSHLIEADFFNIKTTEEFPDHLGIIAQK
ncbi:MAG: class I SAM-dependent methyltransferase [Marinilabilia sp.]